MSDLRLDADGDLDCTGTGPRLFSATETREAIAQRIKIRIRTFLGEWFLDQRKGFPWLQQVLGAKNAAALATTLIRSHVAATRGVLRVDDLEVTMSGRDMLVSFDATTTVGVVSITDETVGA